jgi:spermidine synthase
VYPASVNEVVEIDPAVTEVTYAELGMSRDTTIRTYNQDARLFLIQRKASEPKYDIIIGDVFNDRSTPYHLTTLEFNKVVKAALKENGVYLINLIDEVENGRYVPSFIHTVQQAFDNVYLFSTGQSSGIATFVVMATDREFDADDYMRVITRNGLRSPVGRPFSEAELAAFMDGKKPLLLTDDYAPTDILLASLIRWERQAANQKPGTP